MNEEKLQILAQKQLKEIEKLIKKHLLNYDKKYILESRVKTPYKIRLKQGWLKNLGKPYEFSDINDIIGFRICVENEIEVEKLTNYFSDNFNEIDRVDYFNNPKMNGFKAYLLYFCEEKIEFEIQFMTLEMLEFTNLTHDQHDELKYGIKIV